MKKGSKAHLAHLKRAAVLGGIAKGKLQKSPYERFMEAIKVDQDTGCWIWSKNLSRGYGSFKVNGRSTKATRWAYEHFKKVKIESKKIFVCHTCDVRACVNPEHLFLGTTQDNMDDAKVKDRFVKGSSHPSSKLSEANVFEIRRLGNKEGMSLAQLSKKFNVSKMTIIRIRKNRGWKHVP